MTERTLGKSIVAESATWPCICYPVLPAYGLQALHPTGSFPKSQAPPFLRRSRPKAARREQSSSARVGPTETATVGLPRILLFRGNRQAAKVCLGRDEGRIDLVLMYCIRTSH